MSGNPTNNLQFKNGLFEATKRVKNSDKEKYVYSGYGIILDSTGSWTFDNDFAGNVINFGVDNSSLSKNDNHKNNLLILGEVPTYGINGRFDSPEKRFSINFSQANTKFSLSLHYNSDKSYFFLNRKEIFKIKAGNKIVNLATKFCLGSIYNRFSTTESWEVSLNGNVDTCMIFQSITVLLINLTY